MPSALRKRKPGIGCIGAAKEQKCDQEGFFLRKWPELRSQDKDPAMESHQKEDPRLWNTFVMLKGQEGSGVLLANKGQVGRRSRLEGGITGSLWEVTLSVVGKFLEALTLCMWPALTHHDLPSWAVGRKLHCRGKREREWEPWLRWGQWAGEQHTYLGRPLSTELMRLQMNRIWEVRHKDMEDDSGASTLRRSKCN